MRSDKQFSFPSSQKLNDSIIELLAILKTTVEKNTLPYFNKKRKKERINILFETNFSNQAAQSIQSQLAEIAGIPSAEILVFAHANAQESNLRHYFFGGSTDKARLISHCFNVYSFCIYLQEQLLRLDALYKMLYQQPLIKDYDVLCHLSQTHKQLITECIVFQGVVLKHEDKRNAKPEALTDLEQKKLKADFALLGRNPLPHKKLNDECNNIFASIFDWNQLKTIFTQTCVDLRSANLNQLEPVKKGFIKLAQARATFIDSFKGLKKPISYPDGTTRNKCYLRSYLQKCEVNKTNDLLNPNNPFNILQLANHATKLIEKSEGLSGNEKSEGSSYKALGYRKGMALMSYIDALKEQYTATKNIETLKQISPNAFQFSGRAGGLSSLLKHRSRCCLFRIGRSDTQKLYDNWLEEVSNSASPNTSRPNSV